MGSAEKLPQQCVLHESERVNSQKISETLVVNHDEQSQDPTTALHMKASQGISLPPQAPNTIEPLQQVQQNNEEAHKAVLPNEPMPLPTAAISPRPQQQQPTTATAQPGVVSGTPTAHGLLSPRRPTPAAAPSTCLSPPSSAIKRENEAALTLAWLAEACEVPSPIPLTTTKHIGGGLGAAADGQHHPLAVHTETTIANPYDAPPQTTTRPTTGTNIRDRRASFKPTDDDIYEYEAMMMDGEAADGEDAYLMQTFGKRRATVDAQRAARRAQREQGAAVAAEAAKNSKPKFIGLHSRVGRAMTGIVSYIHDKQQEYISQGGAGVPERIIREAFGNNPDTSKALRMLVVQDKIVRTGAGGRKEPFAYHLCADYVHQAVPITDASTAAQPSTISPPATTEAAANIEAQQQPVEAANATAPPTAAKKKTAAKTTAKRPSDQGLSLTSPPPNSTVPAAVAAALNVPSTVKPSTAAQQKALRGAARRKQSHQPRLSLALVAAEFDEPIPEESNDANNNDTTLDTQPVAAAAGKRTRKPSAKADMAKETEQLHIALDKSERLIRLANAKRGMKRPSSTSIDGLQQQQQQEAFYPAAKKQQADAQLNTAAAVGAPQGLAVPLTSMPAPLPQQHQQQLSKIESLQTPSLPQTIPGIPMQPETTSPAATVADINNNSTNNKATIGGLPSVLPPPSLGNMMLVTTPGGGTAVVNGMQAAYLMQMQAAQAYWRQQMEANNTNTAVGGGAGTGNEGKSLKA